jgi:hypothetical protein
VASITKHLISQQKPSFRAGPPMAQAAAARVARTGFARGLLETLDSGPMA